MHFLANIENGLEYINVYITEAKLNGKKLKINDEIGIFDESVCIGSSKIIDSNLLSIIVSNYHPQHKIEYKFWIDSKKIEIENVIPTYLNNDNWSTSGLYESNSTVFVKLNKNE